jgi:hypothetical protein
MFCLNRFAMPAETLRGSSLAWFTALLLLLLTAPAGATPWQHAAQAQCGASSNCILTFPSVDVGSRLEVRQVGCEIRSTQLTTSSVRFYLQTKQNGSQIALDVSMQLVSGQNDGTNIYSTSSESMSFYVPPQQTLKIVAWPGGGYTIDQMNCAVRGELTDAANTAPYQAAAGKNCSATANCILNFPKVPSGKRFDIRYAACEIRSSTGAAADTMRFYLQSKQNGNPITEDLATVQTGGQYESTGTAYTTISQPVQFSVPAGQQLSIVGWLSQGNSIDRMDCTIVGAMNDAAAPGPYLAAASGGACSATTDCIVSFPPIPAGRQLEVQFVACELRGTQSGNAYPAVTQYTRLYLQTQQNGKKVTENITNLWPYSQYDGTSTYSAVSEPVAFTVPSQQALNVVAWLSGSIPPAYQELDGINCTISGQLQ